MPYAGLVAETVAGLHPISRALVVAHGGHIGLESTPGEGSPFWFVIPIGSVEHHIEVRERA